MHEPFRDLGPPDIWMLTRIISGAQLTWPINAIWSPRSNVNIWCRPLRSRWPRSGRYTSLQDRAVTCFSDEAKWLPTTTYVVLEWWDVNSAPRWRFTILFHQRTRGKINGRGSLPLALLCLCLCFLHFINVLRFRISLFFEFLKRTNLFL